MIILATKKNAIAKNINVATIHTTDPPMYIIACLKFESFIPSATSGDFFNIAPISNPLTKNSAGPYSTTVPLSLVTSIV